ncbi:MAG TPA: carboxypeptidase-like regulatory domain-containing protein [Ferruginibacter sp.]|nr:carboxypeptidase-like regulatory domain-containing protein [Ferruginibacter sp.]
MNRTQESLNDMYDRLILFLDGITPATLLMMAHFPAYYTNFKAAVAALFHAMEAQRQDRSGYAKSKATARALLNATLFDLAIKLTAYANFIEDEVLLNKVDFSKSELENATDSEISAIGETLINTATELVAELEIYGITAESIDEDTNVLESYRAAKPKPINARKDKKIATKAIKTAIKTANKFLGKMDVVVLTIAENDPPFVQEYFEKRKADKPQSSVLAASGFVTDQAGNPMPYVLMICEELGISRKISINGRFIIKSFTEGIKQFTFIFPGFQTVTQSVTFTIGIRAEIRVTMIPH